MMRDDARRKTGFMTDLMEIIAELSNERLLTSWSGQEELIFGEPFQRAKEAQPLDELADKRIHWDQPFGFQFPKRHMDGPLIRASGTQTVRCKIGALTDTHPSVTNQQKDVRAQVVAAKKLLLQQLILFSSKRTRQSVRKARDVLAPNEMSEIGKFVCPRQFMEGPAQRNQRVDIRGSGQGRRLGAQTRHPPEDVGFTAELGERAYLWVCGAEICQEIANGPAVVPSGFGMERSSERRDGPVEGISQRMLKWRSACSIHGKFPGRGRLCLATARAYSR